MEKYFTKEGLEKLKAELNYLRKVKQKEIAQAINKAAAFGDLSENAAYHQAKEELAFLRGRLAELEKIIANAQVIEPHSSDHSVITLGSKIEIEQSGKKEKFQIVLPAEADLAAGKISSQSPLGKALLGKKAGEKIEIDAPKGKICWKIIKVS
jgi:transcription elongation factor GreA